jgi:hypothetical protein
MQGLEVVIVALPVSIIPAVPLDARPRESLIMVNYRLAGRKATLRIGNVVPLHWTCAGRAGRGCRLQDVRHGLMFALRTLLAGTSLFATCRPLQLQSAGNMIAILIELQI